MIFLNLITHMYEISSVTEVFLNNGRSERGGEKWDVGRFWITDHFIR